MGGTFVVVGQLPRTNRPRSPRRRRPHGKVPWRHHAGPHVGPWATWKSDLVVMIAVQDSGAPRPGRRFEPSHERALHDDALSVCAQLPGAHRGTYVVREMTGPIGIPDFTVLIGDVDRLHARLSLDVAPVLNQLDASIVAVANSRVARSASALARTLNWGVQTVLRRLPGLLKSGALVATRPDRYVRP